MFEMKDARSHAPTLRLPGIQQVSVSSIGACFRPGTPPDPEDVTRAVFKVLARHVTSGEIRDVKQLLAKELRELVVGACGK